MSRGPFALLRRLLAVIAVLVLIAVVAGAVWVLTHRDHVRAWRQAATIAADLGNVPVATTVLGWIDEEIDVTQVTTRGGLPATIVAPAGGGRHPTIVVLVPNDTTPEELASLADMQRAMSRAGIAAWALRVPDPGQGLGDASSIANLSAALDAIRGDRRTDRDGISIIASGALASQALVAAGTAPLRAHVLAVLAVQPVADVQGLVRLAITGSVRGVDGVNRPHPAAERLRRAAGRAVVDALRAAPGQRPPLVDDLLDRAAASDDPISALGFVPRRLLPADLDRARDVLEAPDPQAFDAAWARLPASIRAEADARSPLAHAESIGARVLVAVPEDDGRFPAADAERLEGAIDGARLHRTRLLDPGADLPGDATTDELRAALAVSAWWLRRAGA